MLYCCPAVWVEVLDSSARFNGQGAHAMEELKAHLGKYIIGAIGGAIVILVLGFWVGPLTTNSNSADLAATAASDRDVAYCVANAQKLVTSLEVTAPSDSSEKTELARASFVDLLPDQTPNNTAVRNCSRAFPDEF